MFEPDHETVDSDTTELPVPIGEGELVSASGMKPLLTPERIAIFAFCVVGPIVFHLAILAGGLSIMVDWQSGNLREKFGFLLRGGCGWPMFPLLGFSIFCLSKVGFDERQTTKRWVRFGVFTGVPITAWYLFAFCLLFGGFVGLIGWLLAAGIFLTCTYGLYLGIKFLLSEDDVWLIALGFVCFVVVVGLAISDLIGFLLLPFIIPLVLSTPLAFLVYLGMSIRIFVKHRAELRFSIAELMAGMTWLGVFFGAARAAITMSLAEYAKLPLEPPQGCYVATAAAQGYPAIVKSSKLPAMKGQSVFVNQQLTTFKTAELTLRASFPAAHRAFRFIYNRVGPPLAAMLSTPMLATLAYLSLKPAEWMCWLCLRILLGGRTLRRTKNLYFERAAVVANSRSHENLPE